MITGCLIGESLRVGPPFQPGSLRVRKWPASMCRPAPCPASQAPGRSLTLRATMTMPTALRRLWPSACKPRAAGMPTSVPVKSTSSFSPTGSSDIKRATRPDAPRPWYTDVRWECRNTSSTGTDLTVGPVGPRCPEAMALVAFRPISRGRRAPNRSRAASLAQLLLASAVRRQIRLYHPGTSPCRLEPPRHSGV